MASVGGGWMGCVGGVYLGGTKENRVVHSVGDRTRHSCLTQCIAQTQEDAGDSLASHAVLCIIANSCFLWIPYGW